MAVEIVTSENLEEFTAKKLDIVAPELEKHTEESKIESKIAETEQKTEEDLEKNENEDQKETELKEEPKKHTLKDRMKELTDAKKSAIVRAESEEKKSAELARENAELKAKLSPPKKQEEDSKPDPAKFTDAFEYAEKLADWSTRQALKARDKEEENKKWQERERQNAESWKQKVEETKKEHEDYEEIVNSSQLLVSDEVSDAIKYSPIGPKILYHLATNPDVVAKLAKMNRGDAIKHIGKIEGKLEDAPQGAKKSDGEVVDSEVKISKAPPPISPLKGKTPDNEPLISSAGEFKGTYEQWKQGRNSGKIK